MFAKHVLMNVPNTQWIIASAVPRLASGALKNAEVMVSTWLKFALGVLARHLMRIYTTAMDRNEFEAIGLRVAPEICLHTS